MPDRCVVYKCTSGYDSDRKYRKANNLLQLSQFRAPKGMLQTWEKIISRGGDFKLLPTHTVCELHFDKSCIVKPVPLIVGGMDISPNGGAKYLLPTAVPTVLKGYPSYMVPKLKTKRGSPEERTERETKQRRLQKQAEVPTDVTGVTVPGNVDTEESVELELKDSLSFKDLKIIIEEPSTIPRPNSSWHVHKGNTFTSFVHINNEGTQIDRLVKFIKGKVQPEISLMVIAVKMDFKVIELCDVGNLLQKVEDLIPCPGPQTTRDSMRSLKCTVCLNPSGKEKKAPLRCSYCSERRRSINKYLRREIKTKINRSKKLLQNKKNMKSLKWKISSRNKKISILQGKLENLAAKCAALKKSEVEEYVKDMPHAWRLAILTCVDASKFTSTKSRRYTMNWVYECSLLRIKSLSLYKMMLRHNFLPLPSLRQLNRYMKKLRPAYGFNENIFSMMKEKAAHIHESKRHGSLLVDEVKLSEALHFDKEFLKVIGFVDLGKYTPESEKNVAADHALVLMFQGFQDPYFQSLSAHLSKGAVKGPQLAKLLVEAIGLLESSGYFVDVVVSDAAPWNRNMWHMFGLKKKKYEKEQSKKKFEVDDADTDEYENDAYCTHPVDTRRKLWFASDFPHLIKSVKQRVINAEELETPDGAVKLNHWRIVCKEDEKKGIKVAPKLSMAHFQTECYAAMSVKTAFSFFSEQVATAMEHYRIQRVPGLEDCASSVSFIRRINVLIDVMNSNTRMMGLKDPDSTDKLEMEPPPLCPQCLKSHAENSPQRKKTPRKVLEDFLSYLTTWETSKVTRDKRLTASAAFGLRVTIQTALDVSSYLIKDVGYEYFMTRRMNQDALEHFFGNIRQGCGAHGHPDPVQFIQVFRLMSFKALVKPPRGSNVMGGHVLQSLLALPDTSSDEKKNKRLQLEKDLDEALDSGEIISCSFSDHTYYENLTIDEGALRFFGGYVARRTRNFASAKKCDNCFSSLKAPEVQLLRDNDDLIHSRSAGYLLTPSDGLMDILKKLERAVLEVFQISQLHQDLLYEIADHVKTMQFTEVGCELHKRELTKSVISFYLNTRLIFACEEYNRRSSDMVHKKTVAKQQQKIFRLTC